jgi:glycosyltransferase involved in cell wall biosynthesis
MKPSLHVAVVTETYPPEVNGVAMTIGRMVNGLLARGHRVSLTRPRQAHDDDGRASRGMMTTLIRGLPIPGYPGLKLGMPAQRKLRRQWAWDRPDIIQVVTEGPLGASAISAARALGIPVVSEFHTNFHSYSRHYGFGWLEPWVAAHLRRLHNRSDVTLAPSNELASRLTTEGYESVQVVARGVDTALFNPSRRCASLRASWGVAPTAPVIAYVGRLAPEKNLPLVLKTFDVIHTHAPSARLLLVGDGPAKRHLDHTDNRYVFAGMRHGEDLARHYASADLFLFPSLTDTFGNVTLEALASGLPVIAYRVAAAAELIRNGENGMLASPGDSIDYLRATLDFFQRPGALTRGRDHATQSIAAWDWEHIYDQLVDTLRETIAAANSRPMNRSLLKLATR